MGTVNTPHQTHWNQQTTQYSRLFSVNCWFWFFYIFHRTSLPFYFFLFDPMLIIFEHADCLPSLHRWCSCGADGVKSGGKYGQYRQTYRHIYDIMDSISPYIRYRQIVRALDFPLNQLVQGSSPWRITNINSKNLLNWQVLW